MHLSGGKNTLRSSIASIPKHTTEGRQHRDVKLTLGAGLGCVVRGWVGW